MPTTISIEETAELLGVHYMTAYRYVRTGQLDAEKHGATWRVDPASVQRFVEDRARPSGSRSHGAPRASHRERLRSCLVAGDDVGAWQVVEGALASGASPTEVYLDVLGPTLTSIGDDWEQGDLTVAAEHRASQVANRIIGRLGGRFRRRGRRRGSVVLGTVAGDHHGLPTAMLADLWRGVGLEVHDLGADTPVESFVETARTADRLLAVGVSVTAPDMEESVRATLAGLRAAELDVPLLLGGRGVRSAEAALELGADRWADDGWDAMELITELLDETS